MKRKLFHNWGLKLASLVLAFILWFLVVIVIDSPQTKTFRNVQVELVNTELFEQEDKVFEVLDGTNYVNVSVVAPSSVVAQINESDIVVWADVNRLTDISTIPIEVDVSNSNVISATSSREVVRLSVEDRIRKYVPLSYSTEGDVANGYMIGNVSLDQNMIEISGPKSAVENVAYARVNVNVSNAANSLSANMETHLYDKEWNEITSETISKQSNYVRVTVEVLATKSVPVYADYSGVPADGYLVAGEVETTPSMVKIAGSVNALAGVNEIRIPEERIDISDAEADVVSTVDIREYLPDNVRLADGGSDGEVSVLVPVQEEAERHLEIAAEALRIVNVPDGFTAELEEDMPSYAVTLVGQEEQLNGLDAARLTGTVDVKAWMEEQEMAELSANSYYIPVDLQLEEGISLRAPVNVRVTFRRLSSQAE